MLRYRVRFYTHFMNHEEKLAQSVEQLPFKEWVPGSIPGLLKNSHLFTLGVHRWGLEGLVPFV